MNWYVLQAMQEDEFELSYKQESFFANKPHFYYFFRELFFQRKTLDEIQKHFALTQKSIVNYLSGLEKIGLIEVHPYNRIKFLVSGKQKWNETGPWYKKHLKIYMEHILKQIQDNPGKGYTSNIGFVTLSQDDFERFIAEIKAVEKKYRNIAHQDYLFDRHLHGVNVSWNFNIAQIDVFEKETLIKNI